MTKRAYKIKDPISYSESRRFSAMAPKTPYGPRCLDRLERPSPYPNTDTRREYMRRYVANRRASETPAQRDKRLSYTREYMEKRYWAEKLKAGRSNVNEILTDEQQRYAATGVSSAERDAAELLALRAKLKAIGDVLNQYANHPLIRTITAQLASIR
jgi:hypothetical protein